MLLQVVLHLLLRLGQRAFMNYSFALEYDNMQFSLQGFFCIYQDDGKETIQLTHTELAFND